MPQKIRPYKAILVYFLAALFLCYEMAVQVSPSVMTQALMHDLKIDAAALGLIGGAYFYSYSIMQIPAGLLFDRLPVRGILLAAVGVCTLGVLLFSQTHTVLEASLGRFFMGFGSAFAFVGVLVVASTWFDRRYFAFLVGVAQLLAALGAINGEVPLAFLLNHYGWRETMWILAGIGLVLVCLIALFVCDAPDRQSQRSNALPLAKSLRCIMRKSQTWWVALYAFAAWAPMTAFAELWGVPYLQAVYNLSRPGAASAVAMVWLGVGLTSPVLGWLSDRLGRRAILLKTCALCGLLASAAVIYIHHLPLWLTYVLLFVFGIGVAGQILSFAVVKDSNANAVVATAIGLNNMAVVVGGALFQPLVGWLMASHFTGQVLHGVPEYSVGDYRFGLLVVPLSFVLGFIASAFFIKETYCQQVESL